MHGNPTAAPHTECADFSCTFRIICIEPYSGKFFNTLSIDIVFRKCADNYFFKQTKVFMNIVKKIIEI